MRITELRIQSQNMMLVLDFTIRGRGGSDIIQMERIRFILTKLKFFNVTFALLLNMQSFEIEMKRYPYLIHLLELTTEALQSLHSDPSKYCHGKVARISSGQMGAPVLLIVFPSYILSAIYHL